MSINLKDSIQNEISGGCGGMAGQCYFERQRTDSENLMIKNKQHGGKKQKGGTKVMNNVGDVGGEANVEVNDNLQKILEVGRQLDADAAFDGCVGKTECMSMVNGGSRRRNKRKRGNKRNTRKTKTKTKKGGKGRKNKRKTRKIRKSNRK